MALASVETFKKLIGIPPGETSQDFKLEFYLDAASGTIEGITGRSFQLKTYEETISGTGSGRLRPQNYPIVELISLNIAGDRDFLNPVSLLNFADYGIAEDGLEIVSYGGGFMRGRNNIRFVYKAGYAEIPKDLQYACILLAQSMYFMDRGRDAGRASKSKGDESYSTLATLPVQVREIVQRYKNFSVPNISQAVRVL